MAQDGFYLSVEQLAGLSGGRIGNLDPVIDWAEGRFDFMICDNFDHGLRSAQHLLLLIGNSAELRTASGRILRQDAVPDARFAAQFGDGPVKDVLADLSPLRALLPIAAGTARSGQLSLMDGEGKTRARAFA